MERITEYDFMPTNNANATFKDPKDFTNILFKRLSYHYEDGKGNSSDFVIAKGIPPRQTSTYFNISHLSAKLEAETKKLEQSEYLQATQQQHSGTPQNNNNDNTQNKNSSNQQHPHELEDLLGITKRVRRPSLIEHFSNRKIAATTSAVASASESRAGSSRSGASNLQQLPPQQQVEEVKVPGFAEICMLEQSHMETVKQLAARKILQNELNRIQLLNNFESFQLQHSSKKNSQSQQSRKEQHNHSHEHRRLYSGIGERPSSVGDDSFMRQTHSTKLRQKDPTTESGKMKASFYSAFGYQSQQRVSTATTPKKAGIIQKEPLLNVQLCEKLTKVYPEKLQSQAKFQIRRRSFSHRSSISVPDPETDMQFKHSTKVKTTKQSFAGFRRPVSILPTKEKNKFHNQCLKFQSISSFTDYISYSVKEDKDKESFPTPHGQLTASEQSDIDAEAEEARKAIIERINRRNINLLKQEQHQQLLKVVDAFQQKDTTDKEDETSSESDHHQASSEAGTNLNISRRLQQQYQFLSRPMSSFSDNNYFEHEFRPSSTQTPVDKSRFSSIEQGSSNNNNNQLPKQFQINISNRVSPAKSLLARHKLSAQSQHSNKQQQQNNEEQVEENSAQKKALSLKSTYIKMKNESVNPPPSNQIAYEFPKVRIGGMDKDVDEDLAMGVVVPNEGIVHLNLEDKQKLYSCVEEGEDEIELKYSKPKKFIKRQVVNTAGKGKKTQSFVESVMNQQNQISLLKLKQRFGRSISKLFEFLQLCIRLKVCIDDIIEDKVFTTKAYERNGSYVFFKMVKQNKLDSVRSQINECRWRIFDFDHLHMTPLHIAVIKGYKELAFYLIEQYPDLEAEDIDNKTPLWYALKHKQFEIARYLLMNKANPWANDNFRYYDIVDDPDMRASLKVARQLWILLKITSFKKREEFWNTAVNRILDPIFFIEDLTIAQ